MFDRIRRIWRVDETLARRLSQGMRERFLLLEENRRLLAVVDKYERGRFEKTTAGTIDWRMEVERLNRRNNELDALARFCGNGLAQIEHKLMAPNHGAGSFRNVHPFEVAVMAHERLERVKAVLAPWQPLQLDTKKEAGLDSTRPPVKEETPHGVSTGLGSNSTAIDLPPSWFR